MGLPNIVSIEDWRSKVKAGQAPLEALLRKQFVPVEVKADEGAARTVSFTISTASVDRDRDTIAVAGWKLDNFLKNPVVLWAHMYYAPPIGTAESVSIEGDSLRAVARFATAEEYAFADTIYRLLVGRFLRATSVGFYPLKWVFDEERGGYDFIEQELREFSVCPVPANPEALVDAKAAGIDLAPLKAELERGLDMLEPGGLWLPRDVAARALKASMGEPVSVPAPARTPDPQKAAPAEPEPFVLNPDVLRASVRSLVQEAASAEVNRALGRLD